MYSLILFLAAVVGERKKGAAELAAEKDDELHAEMVAGSDVDLPQFRGVGEESRSSDWLLEFDGALIAQ